MTGGIQVVRFELRAALDKPLYDHVRGLTRPPTAYGLDDDPVPENETDEQRTERREAQLAKLVKARLIIPLGGVGLERARKILAEHRAKNKNRRGRKAKPILDGLIAGPHPRGSSEEWTRERVEKWGKESLDWVKRDLGRDMVIVEAAIHLDETSPHLQFLAIPIEGGKLSWKAVRDAAAKRIREARGPEPGRKSRGFRDAYRVLQDDYHARVGVRYGLERGEVGSEATHRSIDRTKAAEHRARLAIVGRREAHKLGVVEEGARLIHAAVRDVHREAEDLRRRDVAEMLRGAARVVAEHERVAVRERKLPQARRLRRMRASARIRRREREAAVECRESAVQIREDTVAAAESRLRSGMVGILRSAAEFARARGRVLSQFGAVVARQAEMAETLDAEREVLAKVRTDVREAADELTRIKERQVGVFDRLLDRAKRVRDGLRARRRRQKELDAEIEAKGSELEVRRSRIVELDGLVERTRRAACDEELKRAEASDARVLAQAAAENAEARRRAASVDAGRVIRAVYSSIQLLGTTLPERLLGAFNEASARDSGQPVVDLEAELRREHEQEEEKRVRLRAGLRDSSHSRTEDGIG